MQSLLRALRVAVLGGLSLSLAASCATSGDDTPRANPTSPLPTPALAPAANTTPNGGACNSGSECVSGNCVDSVCCATKCGGGCKACSAATKQSGLEDGKCGNRKAGLGPKGGILCAIDPGNECNAGTCNGAGTCGKAVGTKCGSERCQLNNTEFLEDTCGPSGDCDTLKTTQCGAYLCDDVNLQCLTSCTASSQCQPGYFCRGGKCLEVLNQGSVCSLDEQCKSGHCFKSKLKVSGVCCDKACTSPCNTCFGDEQAAGFHGICLPTRPGIDPNDECIKSSNPCLGRGVCQGNGGCEQFAPAGEPCGGNSCQIVGGKAQVSGSQCDGAGKCDANANPSECVGYKSCNGNTCASSCTSDDDCQATHFCKDDACLARSKKGACAKDSECLSNNCVDGYCCDTKCLGDCEACDVTGEEGTCTLLVAGEAPHGDRKCAGAGSSGNPCTARICDGKSRADCEGFVGAETTCGPSVCTQDAFGSTYLPEQTCDGNGQCAEPNVNNCGAFACNQGCVNSCTPATEKEDCAENATCIDGKCILTEVCVDDENLALGTGEVVSCVPYQCRNGDCLNGCASNDDCSEDAVCDAKAGTCASSSSRGDDPGDPGCGCRAPGGRSSFPWALSLALLALLLLRRRAA